MFKGTFYRAVSIFLGVLIAVPNLALATNEDNRNLKTTCNIDPAASAQLTKKSLSLCKIELGREDPLVGLDILPPKEVGVFKVKTYTVRGLAYQQLHSQYPVKYRFSILDKKGAEKWFFNVATYEALTKLQREMGEISDRQRIYHVDAHRRGKMKTYAFSKTSPTYHQAKAYISKILLGNIKETLTASLDKPIFRVPSQSDVNAATQKFYSLMNEKNYAQAVGAGETAISIFEQSIGPNHPNLARFIRSVSVAYIRNGQNAKAAKLLKRCAKITETARGMNSIEFSKSLDDLSSFLKIKTAPMKQNL